MCYTYLHTSTLFVKCTVIKHSVIYVDGNASVSRVSSYPKEDSESATYPSNPRRLSDPGMHNNVGTNDTCIMHLVVCHSAKKAGMPHHQYNNRKPKVQLLHAYNSMIPF